MIYTLENVKATVSGTRRKDLMTKIRSSRCKSLTSKMLMEIDVSSDRESDFTASVLPVDKKKIEYRVRAVGVDASVTVKSWTLLDDSATLSRVQINRCHNLSSYLVETLLHVAVNSSSWVQITQCEFWSWIKVPRYDFATFAWPETLQSCWKAWNQLIAISINFHHFFRIESKFRLSKQHFWKKKKNQTVWNYSLDLRITAQDDTQWKLEKKDRGTVRWARTKRVAIWTEKFKSTIQWMKNQKIKTKRKLKT